MKKVTLGLALLTSASLLNAQELNNDSFTTWRLSLDSTSFNKEKAVSQGISDSSVGLGLALDYKKSLLVAGFGMFAGPVDDENEFSQLVIDQNNNVSVADSSTSALSFFAEVGASYNYNGSAYLDLVGGYQSLRISRSISNCTDCDTESLDLSGGMYIKPRVKVPFGDKFLGSIAYTSYMSGDIESALVIGFEGRF